MNPIKLTLPIPVSINALYANSKKGRKKTRRAELWEIKAMEALAPQPDSRHAICRENLIKRWKFKQGRKTVDLRGLAKAHPNLFYFPIYKFAFHSDITVKPTDVSNFIKHLEDFLVDTGFFLEFLDKRKRPFNVRVKVDENIHCCPFVRFSSRLPGPVPKCYRSR